LTLTGTEDAGRDAGFPSEMIEKVAMPMTNHDKAVNEAPWPSTVPCEFTERVWHLNV